MDKQASRAVRMIALSAALLVGCEGDSDADRVATREVASPDTSSVQVDQTTTSGGAQQQSEPDMRLQVNLAERQLYVHRGGEQVESHPVAVGSEDWPTPTGEWSIGQVVWNPRWIPPNEEWAEGEEEQEPGPDNPLGKAQLVYSPPNTIHGTNDPSSIGQAVSHGSIRVSNEVAMDLARQVMEAGGADRDEEWYQAVRDDPTRREEVNIPDPVPVSVVSGD